MRRVPPTITTLATAASMAWSAIGAAEPPPRPVDHVATTEGLSTPIYDDLVFEQRHVPTSTGAELYVEITRPDTNTYRGLRVPVIMRASPYNAGTMQEERAGTPLVREARDEAGREIGMAGWFPPRGYAWVSVDLRGTGYSSGCFDHLGPLDQQDLRDLVAWVATRSWSNGRVATIGHSYDGFTALMTAAVADEVVGVVASAGGASLYDHQFQKGVPFLGQWAGTSIYPAIAATRFLRPGSEARKADHACGFASASGLDGPSQVTGQMGPWHHARDHRQTLADREDLAVFINQGLDDEQIRVSAMEWFLTQRPPSPDDHLWIGPWHHSEETHLNGRPGQWLGVLHAWFDRVLQQRDVTVGPAVEAFQEDGQMLVLDQWEPAADRLLLWPDATDFSLDLVPPAADGTAAFTATGNSQGVRRVASDLVLLPDRSDGGIDFLSEPLDRDVTLMGLPQLELHASVTGEVVHLVTTLYRVDELSRERLLNTCAIQPQLREGIDTLTPVVPGEVMALPLQCFATSHHLQAGDRLRLHVGTGSLHHVGTNSVDARIEVHTGPDASTYSLPDRSRLPRFEAPPPVEPEA